MARRIPFVVLVLALFLAGIGLTLWLTTSATARSHEVSDARQANARLLDEKESLEQVVQAGNSAPELADKAAGLGMVQATDVARLVVAPDGSVTVHGTPEPAEGPTPHDLSRGPGAGGSHGTAGGGPAADGEGSPAIPLDADAAARPPSDGGAANVLPPADARVLASVPRPGADAPTRADTPGAADPSADPGGPVDSDGPAGEDGRGISESTPDADGGGDGGRGAGSAAGPQDNDQQEGDRP